MKIYISLPITGHDIEEVEASCIYASGVIQAKGHTPVSPLDISPDPDATYSEHMGNDIEALLNCDAVLFMEAVSKTLLPKSTTSRCSIRWTAFLIPIYNRLKAALTT